VRARFREGYWRNSVVPEKAVRRQGIENNSLFRFRVCESRIDYSQWAAYDWATQGRFMIGRTITHYRILHPLGRGGMGEVYEAEDVNLRRHVAVKFLTDEYARKPDAVERFWREARLASSLNHPHICTVHEIGESEGQYFIVTELLQGQNLQQRLAQGPIEGHLVHDFAVQIADALGAAHERGIVHRDLKPSNIFITHHGRLKLLDFGLAKLSHAVLSSAETATIAEGNPTSPGVFVGTLSYMSPEQLRDLPITPATDVFSLGIVLWEMLTGVHPFSKKTPLETASSILSENPPLKGGNGRSIPQLWLPLLQKMMNKDESSRYANAQEVHAALLKLKTNAALDAKGLLAADPQPPLSRSIAILPFRNLSRDPDNEYFSDGLTEELINVLSKISDLRVAARSSSFRFREKDLDIREIGNQLAVSSILDGSVQKSGNRIRISGQLVDTADGFQLWSGKYDRELSDVFALQDEIAQAVVASLQPALATKPAPAAASRGDGISAPAENGIPIHFADAQRHGNAAYRTRAVPRQVDAEAYNEYLKGRFFWNKRTAEDLRKAIEHFRRAISLEANFAAPLAGIADSYITLAIYGVEAPGSVIPLARESAQKALELDPQLADAHASLGSIAAFHDWDWGGADRHFQRAIEITPNYATAHHWYATSCLVPQARFAESRRQLQLARELEPVSLAIGVGWGGTLFFERRYEEAIEALTQIVNMDRNFGMAHFFLGQTYAEKRRFEDAIRELQLSAELNGRSPESLAVLGAAYARAGRTEDARKILQDLRDRSRVSYVSPVLLAQIMLGLKEKKEALEYLCQARELRAADLVWLKVRPIFDDLRQEPSFGEICKEIGLSD
jgi:serine/threonine protein kinase/Tfp pilus assembly protein PilF